MADTPHFDFPFRFSGSSVAVAEQDSLDDIGNCVTVALLTPPHWRKEVPEFGVEDRTFSEQPVNWTDMAAEVVRSEPRADGLIETDPGGLNQLIASVQFKLRAREEQVQVADIYYSTP